MKNFVAFLSLLALFAFMTAGCANQAQRDNFFGYDNDPEKEKPQETTRNQPSYASDNEEKAWSNPMAEEETSYAGGGGSVYRADYAERTYYNNMYVPVIVPWWSHYHGWLGRYRSGAHIYIHHGGYWGWDWYSPWYDYHPYYGNYWPRYRPVYHNWYYQPVYSNYTKKVEKDDYRGFGPSRGDYSKTSRGDASKSGYRYRSTGNSSKGSSGVYRSSGESRKSGRSSSSEKGSSRRTTRETPNTRGTDIEPSSPRSSGSGEPSRRAPSSSTPPSRSTGSGSSGSSKSGSSGSGTPQRRKMDNDGAYKDIFHNAPSPTESTNEAVKGESGVVTTTSTKQKPATKNVSREPSASPKTTESIFSSPKSIKAEKPTRRTDIYRSGSSSKRSVGNSSEPGKSIYNSSKPTKKSYSRPSSSSKKSYSKPSKRNYTKPKSRSYSKPKKSYSRPSSKRKSYSKPKSRSYSKPKSRSYSKPSTPSRRSSSPSRSTKKSSGSSSKRRVR